MRSALLLSGIIVSIAFLGLAPTSSAFGWCTSLEDSTCDALVCIGTRWDYQNGYTYCQYAVPCRNPCIDPCTRYCDVIYLP